MVEAKNVLGIVAAALVFIGYIPYIRDILKGKTKPHVYSWFLWGFVTAIAFALQVSGKAGSGSLVALAAASMCTVVFILGMLSKGKKDIQIIDTVFLILAFIALAFWLIAKQPVISAILTTAIDLLGFAPTVRKSWKNPYSETLAFYNLNTARFVLAVISLQTYSLVTALWPVSWLIANGLFTIMLVVRRKQLNSDGEG